MKFIFLANAQDMEAVCNFDESEFKIAAITMPTQKLYFSHITILLKTTTMNMFM